MSEFIAAIVFRTENELSVIIHSCHLSCLCYCCYATIWILSITDYMMLSLVSTHQPSIYAFVKGHACW